MEAELRKRVGEGSRVRLLASYARDWKTKGAAQPHDLPGHRMDFHEHDAGGYWSRPWDCVPNGSDDTLFIQARPGSRINDDLLAEVGCPYAVGGFDYVGLLWLGDLRANPSGWQVDREPVFETGLANSVARVKREKDPGGPAHQQLRESIAQGYRILLTRPMKGLYVWFEDPVTREAVEAAL